jgi:hypothetical protein
MSPSLREVVVMGPRISSTRTLSPAFLDDPLSNGCISMSLPRSMENVGAAA